MEDSHIVELYWQRDESAVRESERKYGKYCYSIAYNILKSREDAEEIVNDTYVSAWNSMPEHRPSVLSTFLGKLTRRQAIKRLQKTNAAKRGGGELALALEELSECIPAGHSVEAEVETAELTSVINDFVMNLPEVQRRVFVCRYWYLDSISDICARFGFAQSRVKTMLHRLRKQLLHHLNKEGFYHDA